MERSFNCETKEQNTSNWKESESKNTFFSYFELCVFVFKKQKTNEFEAQRNITMEG